MERESLNRMTRDELIAYARRIGVERAEVMTRAELADEILRLGETNAHRRRQLRGWFGVARDLLAGVVEAGLHLPDAAKLIRGDTVFQTRVQAPIATVTLAEIYASQGHPKRALVLLDQVLAKEPDHEAARRLRDRLLDEQVALASPISVASSISDLPQCAAAGDPAAPLAEPVTVDPGDADLVRDATRPPEADSRGPAEPTAAAAAPPPPESSPDSAANEGILHDTVPPPPPNADAPTPTEQGGNEPRLDAIFVVAGEDRSHCVYWELSRATRERAAERDPAGAAVVKLVFLTPHPDGAVHAGRDLAVNGPTGATTFEAPSPRAVVRAALGWQSPTGFMPLAVADQIGPMGQPRAWVPSARASERLRPAKDRALAAYRAAAPLG